MKQRPGIYYNDVQQRRALHDRDHGALAVMWRTLQHGRIRFPQQSPSHHLGQIQGDG